MKISDIIIVEGVKQRLDPKCWTGKHKEGTKIKGGVRVNNCVPNESYDPNAAGTKPTMPAGTVRVDVSDVYDWYKLGKNIGNLDQAKASDFGKGPPSTIMAFGSEEEEHKYINSLKKLGLSTTDIDPIDPKQPKNKPRQKTDPTYNVGEAANAAQQAAIAISMKKAGKKPKKIEEDLYLESTFDVIEEMVEAWAAHYGVEPDTIWEDIESVDDADLLTEAEAWQKKSGKNKNGGLNKKGVASYRKSHPGSKLQTAVTTKPSKLKPGSKAAKRRKSFCARMKGMKKHNTSGKTAHDPDSRINKSLRKWHC